MSTNRFREVLVFGVVRESFQMNMAVPGLRLNTVIAAWHFQKDT